MRVWVDCTAAAHPLVLRPIVERLRERGHEVEITAREYGQTVGILDRLGLEHTVVGRHGDSTFAKARCARHAAARARAAGPGRGASTSRSGTARSTWPWSRRCCGCPRRRCRTTSTPASSASSRSGRRAGCWLPDAIPVEAMRRAGAAERKLVRYPGLKEDYYLADFEPDPAVLGGARASIRSNVLVVVRPPPEIVCLPRRQPALRRVLDRAHRDAGTPDGADPANGAPARVGSRSSASNEQRATSSSSPTARSTPRA